MSEEQFYDPLKVPEKSETERLISQIAREVAAYNDHTKYHGWRVRSFTSMTRDILTVRCTFMHKVEGKGRVGFEVEFPLDDLLDGNTSASEQVWGLVGERMRDLLIGLIEGKSPLFPEELR